MQETLPLAPHDLLKIIVKKLSIYKGCFALAGGVAASLYRAKPRLTNDVDIALDLEGDTKRVAVSLLEALDLKVSLGWISDSRGMLPKSVALVIGQQGCNDLESTIDLLLPTFPWLPKAVKRAQENYIDYGFDEIPTLTPEDIIIAKTFALMLEPNRFQDMDDIQSILKQNNNLDLVYLACSYEKHQLYLPEILEIQFPGAIKRVSKNNKRLKRKKEGFSS